MDDVDYLIVGGGTAGCILASRLTESGRHRVLLVEAGGEPRSLFIRVPAGFGHLLRSRRYNWGYESAPDPDTDGRAIPVPSGRGLGGSGLINGMVYVRGQAADYDGWAAAGATGWAHADVEPYFRRLENYAQGGQGRGRDGPLHVTQVRERFPVADAFLRAAVEDGGRLVEDYNLDQDGFGYYQVNQFRGRRWSPYDAYLAPARGRSNLSVMSHTHALGLTFDGRRCTGARVRRGRSEHHVRARREVILVAGAIRSPQLLELSGLGRADVLSSIGVPVRHDLAGVGENYSRPLRPAHELAAPGNPQPQRIHAGMAAGGRGGAVRGPAHRHPHAGAGALPRIRQRPIPRATVRIRSSCSCTPATRTPPGASWTGNRA